MALNTSDHERKREQRAVTTQEQAAISIEPKRPLMPAEEHLAQVLAAIARRTGLRIALRMSESGVKQAKGGRPKPKA